MSRKKWRESLKVPQHPEALAEMIEKIGAIQTEATEITAEAHAAAAKVIAYAERRVHRLDREAHRLDEAVRQYALAHRSDFTTDSTLRMRTFASGKTGWRRTPKAVVLGGQSEEKLVARAKEKGEQRFVRTVEMLDKQTIIKHPLIAKRTLGVRVESDLHFIIDPTGSPAREIRSSRRARWERSYPRSRREVT